MNIVGVFPFMILAGLLAIGLTACVAAVMMLQGTLRKSREFGYPSLTAYLRAAPTTDAEKRDAADLALKGLVLCLLGMMFGPLLLFGLIPLFYGARKLIYAQMGLGLVDDDDQPDR